MTTQIGISDIWAEIGGITDPGAPKVAEGWVAEIPTYQNFNWVLQKHDINLLALAERSVFEWDITVDYKAAAKCMRNGVIYTSRRDHTSIDPLNDAARNYWIVGEYTGKTLSNIQGNIGMHLDNINDGTISNITTWTTTSLHIRDNFPNIVLSDNETNSHSMIGIKNGRVGVVDVIPNEFPNGADLTTAFKKLFHEGQPPIQSQIVGTIPDAPSNNLSYCRYNGTWIEGAQAPHIGATPPPPVGRGRLWYNTMTGKVYMDIRDEDSNQWVDFSPPTAIVL